MRSPLIKVAVMAAVAVFLPSNVATAVVGPPVVASAESPYAVGCSGAPQSGVNFRNSEVEPFVGVNRRSGEISSVSGSRTAGPTAARPVWVHGCPLTAV